MSKYLILFSTLFPLFTPKEQIVSENILDATCVSSRPGFSDIKRYINQTSNKSTEKPIYA
jgi:hypothetical protein